MQDCSNSIANALEFMQSRTKPSVCAEQKNILPAVNIGWYRIFDSVDKESFQTQNYKHVAKEWYCHAKCG